MGQTEPESAIPDWILPAAAAGHSGVRVGRKLGQTGPKWDKSETFKKLGEPKYTENGS